MILKNNLKLCYQTTKLIVDNVPISFLNLFGNLEHCLHTNDTSIQH